MKSRPKIGDIGETSFVVAQEHAIDFADAQMPAVLSTPWLIWFLEHAAREAMLPLLEGGESTVGVHVDVEHLAPTPIGQRVVCTARVINTDGRLISFQLEARDEHERIARGLHKLRIIRCDRFASRVLAKKTPPT
jgi:predicted thioesterase